MGSGSMIYRSGVVGIVVGDVFCFCIVFFFVLVEGSIPTFTQATQIQ